MMFLLIVTVTSMLLAAIMSAIAWRLAGDERRRSDARVSALSAAIHDAAPPAAPAGGGRSRWDPPLNPPERRVPTDPAGDGIFAARQTRSGSRPVAIIAAGALVFAAAIAAAIVFSPRVTRAARRVAPAPAVAAAPLPLELVALGHERVGDQLSVRGVVRNPAAGVTRDRVVVVVQLLTRDGAFLSNGSAELAAPTFAPGGESAFAVTIPDAAAVGRYRVSFRTDQGVVPHVDRRDEN